MSGPPAAAVGVVLAAVALDLAAGDPPNRLHPVAWLGGMLGAARRAWCHGSPPALLLRGAVVTVAVAALAGVVGWALERLAGGLGLAGVALEGAVLSCLLSIRGLVTAARGVAGDLGRGDLAAARRSVGLHLVSRPTAALGEHEVASAAVESVAENLTDALVAPVCFYLAFGLAGAAIYRAVNTADAMIGYRDGDLEHYGKVAARLDDALNLVPARLAGLAIVLAARPAGGSAGAAWRTLLRDRRRTASPNAGWTMAAMAGALGVTLAKPGAYRLGDGRAPRHQDIERGVRIMRAAAGVALGVALVARLAYR